MGPPAGRQALGRNAGLQKNAFEGRSLNENDRKHAKTNMKGKTSPPQVHKEVGPWEIEIPTIPDPGRLTLASWTRTMCWEAACSKLAIAIETLGAPGPYPSYGKRAAFNDINDK